MEGTKTGDCDGTHNFGGETGAVGKMNNGVIEVKNICLVVRLELMKEVEDLECEDGVRPDQRGGKQSPPHQLSAAVVGIFRSAPAVSDDNLMDAAEIEDSELITPGRVWARLASAVTELHHKAEGSEGFGREVLTVPSLRKAKMSNCE